MKQLPDLLHLPLDAIDDATLPRDRGGLDEAALNDLALSIRLHGLRLPVEVFRKADPGDGPAYGLISGLRRLTAYRRLHDGRDPAFAKIPALLRTPRSVPEALVDMVEENRARAGVSPWEQARLLVTACDEGIFDTVEAAAARLHMGATRQARARLRAIADLVEVFEGLLAAPEHLNQRQLLRLSAACRAGFEDLAVQALREAEARDPARQWEALENVLREAEMQARHPEPEDPRPGRPRRQAQIRKGLHIRREMLANGWALRFTGDEATASLMESVMDHVEYWFGR